MTKEIKYKKQGDGRDSWEIKEYDVDKLVNAYMVYEDPNKPVGKVDLVSILSNATPEEIAFLKEVLK